MVIRTFNRRIIITSVLFIIITIFYIFKLFNLHFSDKIFIKSIFGRNEILRRGYIKDYHGSILAISIEIGSVYANPSEITAVEEAASKLSSTLNLSEEYILDRISRKKRFVWIKRKIDDQTAEKIKSLKIPGIYLRKEHQRVYPHDMLASNIIGFTDVDEKGIEGIEFKYNDILSGKNNIIYSDENKIYRYGDNVILTIDKFIQYTAEKYLTGAITSSGAKQGAVVILEVKTGRVLAYAKSPGYNPNFYSKFSAAERSSFTITDSFEPGSTMKIFAAAAWLSSGKADLKKTFMSSPTIDIADTTIKSVAAKGYGLTIYEALSYSCNVAVIRAVQEVPANTLYSTLRKFGFGEKTGNEICGESDGILREANTWSGLSKYSISIGQEIAVTSLQLCAAYSAIANNGIYNETKIVDSIEKYSGDSVQKFYPKTRGQVINNVTCKQIQTALKMVVDSGTGKNAKSPYYEIAGKTGTAQKSRPTGGYIAGKYVVSFAGYAPFENPDICAVVIIDEPYGSAGGGDIAAPVFAKIINDILPYRGINSIVIKSSDPKQSKSIEIANLSIMPNFTGLDLAASLNILKSIKNDYNTTYSLKGAGKIYQQIPAPGTPLTEKMNIILYFTE